MITQVMSVVIGADRERVWRALTEPDQVVAWDDRILAAIDARDDYPFSGQHVRWRYRLGNVQVVLHDRPIEIRPLERLRCDRAVGSMRFEHTFTLSEEAPGPGSEGSAPRTRLALKMVTSSSVPVIGSVVDRFSVRELAAEQVDHTLRSVQRWCEGDQSR